MGNPVVLIVDDEPMIYQSLRRAMHKDQFETLQANNAEEALRILGQRPVDVAIVDEHMPGLRGSALLGRIRAQWPATIRMMLTGDTRVETVIRAINSGEVAHFFTKPANEVDIITHVREALKRRAALRGGAGAPPRPTTTPR